MKFDPIAFGREVGQLAKAYIDRQLGAVDDRVKALENAPPVPNPDVEKFVSALTARLLK